MTASTNFATCGPNPLAQLSRGDVAVLERVVQQPGEHDRWWLAVRVKQRRHSTWMLNAAPGAAKPVPVKLVEKPLGVGERGGVRR